LGIIYCDSKNYFNNWYSLLNILSVSIYQETQSQSCCSTYLQIAKQWATLSYVMWGEDVNLTDNYIYGIDPSIHNTGFCISLLDKSSIIFATNIVGTHDNYYDNAIKITNVIGDYVKKYPPKYAIIESVYSGFNAQTTIKLSMLRGMLCYVLNSRAKCNVYTGYLSTAKHLLGIKKETDLLFPHMWSGPRIKKFNNKPSIKDTKIASHNYIFHNKVWDKPIDDNISDAIILAHTFQKYPNGFSSIKDFV